MLTLQIFMTSACCLKSCGKQVNTVQSVEIGVLSCFDS